MLTGQVHFLIAKEIRQTSLVSGSELLTPFDNSREKLKKFKQGFSYPADVQAGKKIVYPEPKFVNV